MGVGSVSEAVGGAIPGGSVTLFAEREGVTWTEVGWLIIGIAALVTALLGWLLKAPVFPYRRLPFVKRLSNSQTKTIEQGRHQAIVLGNQLWSPTYHGLGLSGLVGLSALLPPEALVAGHLTVSTADGSIAVLAHQIVRGAYQDGFSDHLLNDPARVAVPGINPSAFTAGLLGTLKRDSTQTLLLLGDFGPEALLLAEAVQQQSGETFAAAGTLSAQAALYLSVRDLLIGEEVYLLPGLLSSSRQNDASLWVEDGLRVGLILLLILGAILTMVGVL